MDTHYIPVSDKIKDALLHYVRTCKRGLVIAPLPTAVGKTYSSCQAIAEYIESLADMVKDTLTTNVVSKIVWVTALIKVLPEKDLREAFKKRGLDYDSLVLRVKSNKDCIKDYLNTHISCTFPDIEEYKFQSSWRKMERYLNDIDFYNKDNSAGGKKMLEELERNFNKEENSFRRNIRKMLRMVVSANNMDPSNTKITVEELIYNNPEFKWISDIYPQAREKNYKVLLMTTKKLVLSKTMFVKGQPYLSEDWLNNSIIFIDEFDSTKPEINGHIMEEIAEMMNNQGIEDFKKLFNAIVAGLKDDDAFDDRTFAVINSEKRIKSKNQLLEIADKLMKEYHTGITFRTEKGKNEQKRDFLYYCSSWITTHKEDGKNTLYGKLLKKNVELFFDTKNKEKDEKIETDVFLIRKMIDDINSFIRKFITFIYACADDYMKAWKEDERNYGMEISQNEALNTLLHKFNGLEKERREALLTFYMKRQGDMVNKKYDVPYSYYRFGASFYLLENGPNHNEDTIFTMGRIPETPENILSYMANNALVIGLSATADCPNNLGNYNLKYVRNEIKNEDENGEWHDNFHNVIEDFPELADAIKEELKFKYQKYHCENSDEKITIDARHPLPNTYDLSEQDTTVIESYLPQNKKAKQLAKALATSINKAIEHLPDSVKEEKTDFFFSRYFNIARVIFNFTSNRSHQSCLCLNMMLPGADNTALSENAIKEFVDSINKYYKHTLEDWGKSDTYGSHNENVELFVLRSNNFEEQKQLFFDNLQKGKRLFILSTFATVGAGINLQHPICDWVKPFLVKLDAHEERDLTKKDIDELAILNITNIVVNINDWDDFTWKEQMTNIGQLEEAYESGIISFNDKKNQVNLGFRAIFGEGKQYRSNILKDVDDVDLQATHWVIQVDGRTKRTLWRNKIQTIYIDENILRKLNEDYLQKHIDFHSEEMKAMLKLKKDYIRTMEKDYQDKFYLMVQMKTDRARQAIIRIISSSIDLVNKTVNWSERKMKNFEMMNIKSIRHPLPTPSLLKDRFYEDFFFETPDGIPRNKYNYYQTDEYSFVEVGFEDKETFKEKMKKKLGKAYSEYNVHEMNFERTKLPILLKYPGMREHLKELGVDIKWKPSTIMPTPSLFQERILGHIGEVTGKFILETVMKSFPIILNRMPIETFELFDYEIQDFPGVYIDFKHYTFAFEEDDNIREAHNDENTRKIKTKMVMANAKAAFIVGIVAPDNKNIDAYDDMVNNIHYIPGLINKNGRPASDFIERFFNKLQSYK